MSLIWTEQFLKKYRKWEKKHPELASRTREKIKSFESIHRLEHIPWLMTRWLLGI